MNESTKRKIIGFGMAYCFFQLCFVIYWGISFYQRYGFGIPDYVPEFLLTYLPTPIIGIIFSYIILTKLYTYQNPGEMGEFNKSNKRSMKNES